MIASQTNLSTGLASQGAAQGIARPESADHVPQRPNWLADTGGAHVTISEQARMLVRLQDIAHSHAASARGLLTDLAAQMHARSAEPGQDHLARLAARVQAAASSGDYASLAAPLDDGSRPVALGVVAYANMVTAGRSTAASSVAQAVSIAE